jgi:hypothetical protein
MAALFYVVVAPLIFAVCTLPYNLILVTLLVLALLACSAAERIRRKTWQRRAEAHALARRADEQHAATLRGELYGTYGYYLPAREFLPVSASRAAAVQRPWPGPAAVAAPVGGPLQSTRCMLSPLSPPRSITNSCSGPKPSP